MPLHLLGKKSWNVYNTDNIARVQRDEAAARAREEAEEQRMQEADAERRLAILRGETLPPLPDEREDEKRREADREKTAAGARRDREILGAADDHGRRKRKRAGEDDTDYEMRVARERAEAGDRVARELAAPGTTTSVLLIDGAGHISLFGPAEEKTQNPRQQGIEKNEEAEREAARKKREFEDQYQMRLVNAAGKDGLGLTDGGPWYAAPDGDAPAATLVPSKNVFGRDDPGRKVREAARLNASDPLAMMKSAAAKVRELGKERKREAEEREQALRALRNEEHRREKRRRRREEDEREGGQKDSRGEESLRDSRHSRSKVGREYRSEPREHHRSRDSDGQHDKRSHRDEEPHRRHHHNHDRHRRSDDDRHRDKRQH
ncbi:hypothetical protein B0H66DRAFT_317894 [Apodospora peruviana]|uniref:CBF1-interacting co-repressor CIR N-terminal domain-containing protein n=1 Tax=Apodospora peruviana TaxID=516989 RepID=A0AAE0HXH7_9PEZI|nr:hypothetical protein B0H66DRAFT_317894 [Apodospora peruviana]